MTVPGTVKPVVPWLLSAILFSSAARANICDDAALRASGRTGVPTDVLLTITRLETGRGRAAEPWPWTVNHAGAGTWFRTEDEARAYVFSQVKRGASNLDIGCFQINYRWHSDAFRSLDDMFDPDRNATYAARFLKQLHSEFGNWTEAVGAYHSRTPEFAARYKEKFRQVSAGLETPSAPEAEANGGAWPFLRSGTTSGNGSLFAADARDAQPFISLRRPD